MSAQSVTFTLLSGSGMYYLEPVFDRANVLSWAGSFSGTTATVDLTSDSPPAGVTAGNVTFRVCTESPCQNVVWQKAIPYTITVFSLDTASLAFDLAEGAVSTQAISLAPVDSAHLVTVMSFDPAPWLTVTRDASSNFQVSASAAGLRPGLYQTQLYLVAGDHSAEFVPVTFTVDPALVAPPPDFVVTLDQSGSASLTGEIPLQFATGIAPAWSARSDRAWLGLTTSSGSGTGAIRYSLDPVALGSVANWSDDVGTIEIDPAGASSVTMRITVRMRLPELYLASPPAMTVGAPATVYLHGRGLSQLVASGDVVVSDAPSTAAIPAASDAEVVVSVTPSAAGRFAVSIPNPFSIPTRALELAAHPAGPWVGTKVARAGEIRSAQFDPIRNAVLAADSEHGALVRYQLDGSWQVDSTAIPAIWDLGLSADRETLFAISGDVTYCTGTMWTLDPDTLQTGAASYPLPSAGTCLFGSPRIGAQVTNGGRLWFPGGQWSKLSYFDLLARTFATYSGPTVLPGNGQFRFLGLWAAPDGSRMVISQSDAFPAYHYTAADGVITAPSIPAISSDSAASRDGGVVIQDRQRAYATDTWTLLGDATVAAGTGSALGAQVSPDGSKVYVLVSAPSSLAVARVDVFDTGSLVGGSTDLVKLGEVAVTDQAGDCGPSPAYGCNPIPVLLIGPQGDVLFLVGNQGLVVVPIPPSLAGPP